MIAIFCIFSISLVRGFGDKTLPGIDVSTFSFSTIEHAIACGDTFKLIDFEELTRGDEVLSYDEKNDKIECTTIVGNYKKPYRKLAYMKHIKAEDDWEIRLTPDHLVYVSTPEGVKLKATKSLKVGEKLKTKYGDFEIEEISDTMEFPTAPITENANILAGGTAASVLSIKQAKIGKHLIKTIHEVLTQLQYFGDEADGLLTSMFDAADQHKNAFLKGEKLHANLTSILDEKDLQLSDATKVEKLFEAFDREDQEAIRKKEEELFEEWKKQRAAEGAKVEL